MSGTAKQLPCVADGEVRNVKIDYRGKLDSGELLTGTPTVAEITTTDLTFANEAVSTAALTILGESVAIGQAVQFKLSGQQAGTTYTMEVTAATDATPAQTFKDKYSFRCLD